MTALPILRTTELDERTLDEIRELLDRAFDGDFSGQDWEHALGGVHALVREGAELVGHAALVPRCLVHDGRAPRTGYVEALGGRSRALSGPLKGRRSQTRILSR